MHPLKIATMILLGLSLLGFAHVANGQNARHPEWSPTRPNSRTVPNSSRQDLRESTPQVRPSGPIQEASAPSEIRRAADSYSTYVEPSPPIEYSPDYDIGYECGPQCDSGACGGCGTCQSCRCNRFWVQGDYLLWWTKGMQVPPLVTASDVADAGILGNPSTQILFGQGEILDGTRSGGRIRYGGWLDCCQCTGVEGEYFALGDESTLYSATCDDTGLPVLARPFFNINPRDPITGDPDPPVREDAEFICFPDLVDGTVSVEASTSLQSAGVRLRKQLCNCCWVTEACCHSFMQSNRVDLLVGYRYLRLKDHLLIREDLTTVDQNHFGIFDQFDTQNEFNGVDVGALWMRRRGCWTMEFLCKVALGTNRQQVFINGGTQIDGEPFTGGLLAQRTNIGSYARNEFAVVPELGVTLEYQLKPCLTARIGYSFLYWCDVVRSGDQIDREINPDLLPPETDPFTGPLRPDFDFVSSSFWAQGLTFGLEWRM